MVAGLMSHHPGNAGNGEATVPREAAIEADMLATVEHEGLRIAGQRRPQDVEMDNGKVNGEVPDNLFDAGAMPEIS